MDDGQISGLNHQLDQGSLNWPERETEKEIQGRAVPLWLKEPGLQMLLTFKKEEA